MNPLQNDAALRALLQRVANRDTNALEELYRLTAPRLLGVAMRETGNREHAEDVLQDLYVRLWNNAGGYQAALSPPMAWLGLIVRSRAIDFLRRRSTAADPPQPPQDAAPIPERSRRDRPRLERSRTQFLPGIHRERGRLIPIQVYRRFGPRVGCASLAAWLLLKMGLRTN